MAPHWVLEYEAYVAFLTSGDPSDSCLPRYRLAHEAGNTQGTLFGQDNRCKYAWQVPGHQTLGSQGTNAQLGGLDRQRLYAIPLLADKS